MEKHSAGLNLCLTKKKLDSKKVLNYLCKSAHSVNENNVFVFIMYIVM